MPEVCYHCGEFLDGFESDYCMTWQQAIELYSKNQVLLLWLLAEAREEVAHERTLRYAGPPVLSGTSQVEGEA